MMDITGLASATLLFFVLLLYLFKKWSTGKVELLYTTCSSRDCIRCNKYCITRTAARRKLQQFQQICSSKLNRLVDATEPHITYQHESQKPNVFYVMELQGSSWWQSSSFKNDVNILENNWRLIRDEFIAVYEDEVLLQRHWVSNATESGSWQTFYFYNQGEEILANCRLCPKTHNILKSLENFMPGCIFGNALFSVLQPYTIITEHYGPTNIRIRCHLGLSIPEGCTLAVNGETQSWRDGKCTIFDDSFIHSVKHNGLSGRCRVVFMLDFWHPDLTNIEKEAIMYAFGVNTT